MPSLTARLRNFFARPGAEAVSDRDLSDMGLSRMDLRILQSGLPGARQRVEAMAAQFGLTPADIDADRGTALEVAEACAQCGQAKACMRAMRDDTPLPESGCPNVSTYRAMSFADAASAKA